MSIERSIDLHEAKIDILENSIKKLELETAIIVENLKSIKESIKTMQECLLNVKETQTAHGQILTSIDSLKSKVGSLQQFKIKLEDKFREEEIKKEQVKGVFRFARNNWGILSSVIGGLLILFAALDTAYKMPSPAQNEELKTLLSNIQHKI